jgi:flagellar basal body-associated protein FliL
MENENQNVQTEQAEASVGKKTLMIVLLILIVLLVVGGLGYYLLNTTDNRDQDGGDTSPEVLEERQAAIDALRTATEAEEKDPEMVADERQAAIEALRNAVPDEEVDEDVEDFGPSDRASVVEILQNASNE